MTTATGLIYGPTICMFLAMLSLAQFKIVYLFLARLPHFKSSIPTVQGAQKYLSYLLTFFESVTGPPRRFTPTFTHVLLVAVMICLIYYLDRIRQAIESSAEIARASEKPARAAPRANAASS